MSHLSYSDIVLTLLLLNQALGLALYVRFRNGGLIEWRARCDAQEAAWKKRAGGA